MVANSGPALILANMLLSRSLSQIGLAAVLVALGTGCGGISTTQSVSPATFFLPGLMQNAPPPPPPAELPAQGVSGDLLARAQF